MSRCKGCERRARKIRFFFWKITEPFRRFLRVLSGTETKLKYHKELLHQMIINGARLEHTLAEETLQTANWLGEMHNRMHSMERENADLARRLEELEKGMQLQSDAIMLAHK